MLKISVGFKSVEAINILDKALQMKNDVPLVYFLRGECFSREDEFQRAYDDYSSVIRLEPHFTLAYIRRGNILDRLGKLDKAIEDFTFALKISPKRVFLFFIIIILYSMDCIMKEVVYMRKLKIIKVQLMIFQVLLMMYFLIYVEC